MYWKLCRLALAILTIVVGVGFIATGNVFLLVATAFFAGAWYALWRYREVYE